MSSKVIKWFIRQASFRKPQKQDKSSTSTEADDKRRFSFPRVSLRRRKKPKSNMQQIEIATENCVAQNSSQSPDKCPSPDSGTDESSNNSSPSKSFSDFTDSTPDSENITVIDVENKAEHCDVEITGPNESSQKEQSDSFDSTSDSFKSSVYGEYDLRQEEETKSEKTADDANDLKCSDVIENVESADVDETKHSSVSEDDSSIANLEPSEDIKCVDKSKYSKSAVDPNVENLDPPHHVKHVESTDSLDETKNSQCAHKNENIAVFDEDGDISATTPTKEDSEPFTFPKVQIQENKPLMGILKKDERPKSGEKSKVKIVITQPSPEKRIPPPISPKPLILEEIPKARRAEPEEEYPDDLNPFGDDDEEISDPKITENGTVDREQLSNPSPKCLNPFGSDTEEEKTCPVFESEHIQSSVPQTQDSKSSTNPFGDEDDFDDGRLSPTNPFAGYEDVPPQEIKPNLPPKSDSRIRRGSLSSGPTPHPRKSKLHHGSSASLNSYPVPYPRSLVPSSSSGDIVHEESFVRGSQERNTIHRESLPDVNTDLKRGEVRGSLPPMSRLRYPRKKRTAPLPPGQLPPSGNSPRSRSASISPDERPIKNPPPRPPPPKKSISDVVIEEKFLRKI